MSIRAQKVLEVKAATIAAEIIPQFVTMKRDGANLAGLCPFHNEKSPSFKIHRKENFFKCFGCGAAGDTMEFLMKHNHWGFAESVRYLAKHYNIDLEEAADGKPKEYARPELSNGELTHNAIAMFAGRGISQETLKKMGVTCRFGWMPKGKDNTETACFNYFKNGELANVKYRAVNDKDFMLAKDAELVFYNMDSLKGANSCCITEGEMDALSLIEAGFKSVVSVPNGASGRNLEYLDNYPDLFDHMDKVYIFADNDEPGIELKNELARRIGFHKCLQVIPPQGCKDANDVLRKCGAKELANCVKSAIEFPVEGIYSGDEVNAIVDGYYLYGFPKGVTIGLGEFDEHLQFAPGQWTAVTGIPSHGKSEFCNLLVTRLAMFHGWKAAICAFENEAPIHVAQLQEKMMGKSFSPIGGQRPGDRMDYEEHVYSLELVGQNFFFIKTEEIDLTIDGILEKAADLVRRKGIKVLYVDPWTYIEFSLNGDTETVHISKVLTKITNFCKKYGVHVILVAHPTKMPREGNKFQVPSLYNISGSAHFKNKAWNGVIVYRDFAEGTTDVIIEKVKYHWLGKPGKVKVGYDKMRRQYVPLNPGVTMAPADTYEDKIQKIKSSNEINWDE